MKVKIELEPGQNHEQAEQLLFKALQSKRDSQVHSGDAFLDPAMNHQAKVMERIYRLLLNQMNREILEAIDNQESENGN
jgi:hypothetical protein